MRKCRSDCRRRCYSPEYSHRRQPAPARPLWRCKVGARLVGLERHRHGDHGLDQVEDFCNDAPTFGFMAPEFQTDGEACAPIRLWTDGHVQINFSRLIQTEAFADVAAGRR